ncbi:MAG TPA: M14 family metallopeptidase [Polyangium sp.]|nr:M14 family metallopeptidase [Polyangium sp.]
MGHGSNGRAVAISSTLHAATLENDHPQLANTLRPKHLGDYRGYGEMLGALEKLEQRGARVREVGRSVENEPLFAVELGARPKAGVPTSVVLSAVHPIEWIGIETHLSLLDKLVANPPTNRTILSFPIVNPDGVRLVEQNLREGARKFVRHNARGVDLNRNFDVAWGKQGILQRLLSRIFSRGIGPASEPEVGAIVRELQQRQVDRALSLHSFGGVVMYPPARSVIPIARTAEHRVWAKRIASAADDKPYTVWPSSWWALGFVQMGLELDWFYEKHGATSILVECSRLSVGRKSARWFEPFAWFNPEKRSEVAERIANAALPFVSGAT